MKHIAGPWKMVSIKKGLFFTVKAKKFGEICTMDSGPFDSREDKEVQAQERANCLRIVDCVNACEGLTDPSAFIQAAKVLLNMVECDDLKRSRKECASIMRGFVE